MEQSTYLESKNMGFTSSADHSMKLNWNYSISLLDYKYCNNLVDDSNLKTLL